MLIPHYTHSRIHHLAHISFFETCCWQPNLPTSCIRAHTHAASLSLSLSISLYFLLLSASKPRPYRHRLKRIRHGSGVVKKPIHVSVAPVAKSSKFHRRFRRIRMKRSRGGSRLRSVAVQAMVVHCSTRRRGQCARTTLWRGSAERWQLGPASRAPGDASHLQFLRRCHLKWRRTCD